MLEQLGIHTQIKNEIKSIAHSVLKSNLNWIKEGNMKYKIIKLLEKNRRKPLGSWVKQRFLRYNNKSRSIKEKNGLHQN